MLDDGLMEGGAVPQAFVTQHNGRTATQRWVELLDEAVEAVGGELQDPVAFVQVTVVSTQGDEFGQRRMTDRHAFRPPGRPRGVDHVGQTGRIDRAVEVLHAGGFAVHPIDAQALNISQFRQPGQLIAMGQQQFHATVLDYMTQAFARRVQVQWHIGAARLEHGEQRHGHVQRAAQRHADQHVRTDTPLAQLPGQTVTALVQFGVAQARRLTFTGEDQRQCVRCALYLRFELAMRGSCGVGFGGVVDIQQLRALVGREHRQLGDGLQRVGTDRGQQVAPVPGQASDGRLVKDVGGVGEGGMQLLAFTAGGQHQVAGGSVRALRQCLLPGRQIGHAQAAAQLFVEQVGHHRLVIEHHLK